MCQLGSAKDRIRELHLHPRVSGSHFEASIDGCRTQLSPSLGDQGKLLTVKVPAHASRIELHWDGEAGSRVWSLRLADQEPAPEWLSDAYTWGRPGGGRPEEVKRYLDAALVKATPPMRARAETVRAFIERNEPGADPEAYPRILNAAVAACRSTGQLLGQVDNATVLAQYLTQKHRFGEAQQVLAELKIPEGAPAEVRYDIAYSQGLLALKRGDHRVALFELRQAAGIARQVGLENAYWMAAEQERGIQLSRLGRFEEADALFRMLLRYQGDTPACDRATILNNRAWGLYLAAAAGEGLDDPTPFLREADQVFASSRCPDSRHSRFNTSINLALTSLALSGHLTPSASLALNTAEGFLNAATPLDRLWWLDFQGRLSLQRGDPVAALESFQLLDGKAAAAGSKEDQWRAALGRVRVYEARGQLRAAIKAMRDAESLVDEQLLLIPVDAGRESFADLWEAGSRLHVELLLKSHLAADAQTVARAARARVWRLLAGSGQLSSPALKAQGGYPQASAAGASPAGSRPGPRLGDLNLTYFRLPAAGEWVGFADDGRQVATHRFALPDGKLTQESLKPYLAAALLEPFRLQITRAQRIRVLPYGRLRAVSFHTLPFGGDILLASKVVVYGLDLAPAVAATRRGAIQALVVADPTQSLLEARKEGDEVVNDLGLLAGWHAEPLVGRKATVDAFLRALRGGVAFLHYAGHADFSGRGGWDSQIPFAGEGSLPVGKVLALDHSPTWVVLSGCETGLTDETTQVESQGLAQAFLFAGSQVVIAATRNVEDKTTRELMTAMYRRMTASPDLADLLRRAQLEMRRQKRPMTQWESFRVFVP